jgi:hypothetical protein
VRACVRGSDLVARYGGDEMALLLPKAAKIDAAPVAEKIRRQIEENCSPMGITISVGLAQFPEDAPNREDLIAAADDVLYRAKEFGGNKVCFYHPVRFHYAPNDGRVQQVSLVGDFNNWHKRAHPMRRVDGRDEWELKISLKPGRYRYKFLLDTTQWVKDPQATEFESDGFGGQCSVVVVK